MASCPSCPFVSVTRWASAAIAQGEALKSTAPFVMHSHGPGAFTATTSPGAESRPRAVVLWVARWGVMGCDGSMR